MEDKSGKLSAALHKQNLSNLFDEQIVNPLN